MRPPLHAVCAADTTVQSLLGEGALLRLYPFGRARQTETYPYAVWQTIYGTPENYLGQRPDMQFSGTQVDAYGETWADARAVADALEAAIEPHAHITFGQAESRDPETNAYRVTFTVDWWEPRP